MLDLFIDLILFVFMSAGVTIFVGVVIGFPMMWAMKHL